MANVMSKRKQKTDSQAPTDNKSFQTEPVSAPMPQQEVKKFISMDLGTVNTIVYVEGQGIIFNEPSVIAYDAEDGRILEIGNRAYDIIGKSNRSLRLIRPLASGVIADKDATFDLLASVFSKVQVLKEWKKPTILLACPSAITKVERQALIDIAKSFGAGHVFIEEEVKMAALGGGIDIWAPQGVLTVDIGGGTTDIAVISAGDIVLSDSTRTAGTYFNDEISKYVHATYALKIGPRTAEKIKMTIGSLVKMPKEEPMKVYGRDGVTGMPREISITPEEVREILKQSFADILQLIVEILEKTPAELAGDIYRNGILLCGGGALVRGIATYFQQMLNLPVRVAPEPLLAVCNGTIKYQGRCFQMIEDEKNSGHTPRKPRFGHK